MQRILSGALLFHLRPPQGHRTEHALDFVVEFPLDLGADVCLPALLAGAVDLDLLAVLDAHVIAWWHCKLCDEGSADWTFFLAFGSGEGGLHVFSWVKSHGRGR